TARRGHHAGGHERQGDAGPAHVVLLKLISSRYVGARRPDDPRGPPTAHASRMATRTCADRSTVTRAVEMPLAWHPICTVAPAVRELGTFRLRSGELVHCRIDRSGRLAAYCEAGAKLVPCDLQLVLDAVK